jgi:cell shape-determining protein MreC
MSRRARLILNPKSVLALLVVLCGLLVIAPPSATRWVSALSAPAVTLVSPIAGPVNSLLSVSPLAGPTPDERAAAEAVAQRDQLLQQKLALELENEELRRLVKDMQRGLELNPGLAVRQYTAPVIGRSGDLSSDSITVRAGQKQGVERGAVVVARGVHLVGRVTSVADRFCTVLPITDKSVGIISGVVMLADQFPGPTCQVISRRRAVASGGGGGGAGLVMLVGEGQFFDPATQRPLTIEIGMTVRLQDENWPRSAQRLVIGKVVAIEPSPDNPLRQLIVVKPEIDPTRVSEVTVRWLSENEEMRP